MAITGHPDDSHHSSHSLWEARTQQQLSGYEELCVCACVLPAVVTVLTPVRFLLTVSSAVSEQRAAIYRGIRTLSTPVRLLTWQ